MPPGDSRVITYAARLGRVADATTEIGDDARASTTTEESDTTNNADRAVTGIAVHFTVDLRAWIPHKVVVDPEAPATRHSTYQELEDEGLGCVDGPPAGMPTNVHMHSTRVFEGDGHVAFDDGTYRGRRAVEFDLDKRTNTIVNFDAGRSADFGPTRELWQFVDKNIRGKEVGRWQCLRRTATATRDTIATSTATTVDVEVHAANPLISMAPAIDTRVYLDITDNPAEFTLGWDADGFPSQGVAVDRDGKRQLTLVMNDASCLSDQQVLGIDGAIRLGRGLTGMAVPPSGSLTLGPQTAPTVTATPAPLCDA